MPSRTRRLVSVRHVLLGGFPWNNYIQRQCCFLCWQTTGLRQYRTFARSLGPTIVRQQEDSAHRQSAALPLHSRCFSHRSKWRSSNQDDSDKMNEDMIQDGGGRVEGHDRNQELLSIHSEVKDVQSSVERRARDIQSKEQADAADHDTNPLASQDDLHRSGELSATQSSRGRRRYRIITRERARKALRLHVSNSRSRHPASINEVIEVIRPRFDSPLLQPLESKNPIPNQPYSLPEPHLFPPGNAPLRAVRNRLRGVSWKDIPMASWYADKASPPVLITFDAFGTLFSPTNPIPAQYREAALQSGHDIAESAIKEIFPRIFKEMEAEFPNYGRGISTQVENSISRMNPKRWWLTLITRTLTPLLSPSETLNPALPPLLYERFTSDAGYTITPGVHALFSQIGSSFSTSLWPPRRTMLGVLSNSDPRVRRILESLNIGQRKRASEDTYLFPPRIGVMQEASVPLSAYPAFLSLSYESGFKKPDTRAFDHALALAEHRLKRLSPAQRLTRNSLELLSSVNDQFHKIHIGDSLAEDVVPALGAGWDAILYNPKSATPIESHNIYIDTNGAFSTSPSDLNSAASTQNALSKRKFTYTTINSLDPSVLRDIVARSRIEPLFLARQAQLNDSSPLSHTNPTTTINSRTPEQSQTRNRTPAPQTQAHAETIARLRASRHAAMHPHSSPATSPVPKPNPLTTLLSTLRQTTPPSKLHAYLRRLRGEPLHDTRNPPPRPRIQLNRDPTRAARALGRPEWWNALGPAELRQLKRSIGASVKSGKEWRRERWMRGSEREDREADHDEDRAVVEEGQDEGDTTDATKKTQKAKRARWRERAVKTEQDVQVIDDVDSFFDDPRRK